jgi:hypothetical protein
MITLPLIGLIENLVSSMVYGSSYTTIANYIMATVWEYYKKLFIIKNNIT